VVVLFADWQATAESTSVMIVVILAIDN